MTTQTRTEFEAAAYRLIRSFHWHESPLAVVAQPKVALKIGYDCPSSDRLDNMLAELMGVPVPPIGTGQ